MNAVEGAVPERNTQMRKTNGGCVCVCVENT